MSFENLLSIISPINFANLYMAMLLALFALHIGIIAGWLPSSIVWGGRIQSRKQLLAFEAIGVAILLVIIGISAVKIGWFSVVGAGGVVDLAMKFIAAFFFMSAIGSLLGRHPLERWLMGPVALLLAVLSLKVG